MIITRSPSLRPPTYLLMSALTSCNSSCSSARGITPPRSVKARIRQFVTAHNRDANKHGVGKYGLVSLDGPIFADSDMTRAVTITQGLWGLIHHAVCVPAKPVSAGIRALQMLCKSNCQPTSLTRISQIKRVNRPT
jgi:hypothetical protein